MDYYESLGVSPNASDAVVRVAYRQRLKEVHPDTGSATKAEFESVIKAGTILLDPASRANYDKQRSNPKLRSANADPQDAGVAAAGAASGRPAGLGGAREGARLLVAAFGSLLAVSLAIFVVVVVAPWSSNDLPDEVQSASVRSELFFEPEPTPAPEPTTRPEPTATPATAATPEPTATPVPTPTPEPTATSAPTATSEPAAVLVAEPESDPTPAPDATTVPQSDRTSTDEPDTAPEPTAVPVPDLTPEPAAAAEPRADGLPDIADLPERGAIYRAPKLFLVGPVPSQEVADAFFAKAAAVVGEENVVNEYVVHPDAPLDVNGNVRVEQAVTFETNSSIIRNDFYPALGLAFTVLDQNPQASLLIEGHTDNVGDDDRNLVLSERRAQAVARWLVSSGINSARLTAVGLGELQPIADNTTEEGRSINRRIEFQILNLLG